MRRRELISLVGGAAATSILLPRKVRAQQSQMPVIGFLHARSENDSAPLVTALRLGLADDGFIEGRNVHTEYRWGRGQYEQMPALAAELVRMPVSLLIVGSEPAALAARAATSTVPIVFVVGSDPTKLKLVDSFNMPGGNATGIFILTTELEAKRLGLLHELVPHAELIGVLSNPNFPYAESQLEQIQNAANQLGLRIDIVQAGSPAEIDSAFDALSQRKIAALAVTADPFYDSRRDQLVALAARHAVPTIYQFRQYPVGGGLMSYGIDLPDAYHQAGDYAGRILKGERPSQLPVIQPTKFQFVINLKTAKTLGLAIPSGVLSIADEVIE